jgi:hypothetical protein
VDKLRWKKLARNRQCLLKLPLERLNQQNLVLLVLLLLVINAQLGLVLVQHRRYLRGFALGRRSDELIAVSAIIVSRLIGLPRIGFRLLVDGDVLIVLRLKSHYWSNTCVFDAGVVGAQALEKTVGVIHVLERADSLGIAAGIRYDFG